ncbi:MAG: ribosomal-processing cysteine protease Prp [Clostridium sp.]|nr:ribosomal-processing cysteine protease Prp [Clostridium sp.]
MINVIFVKKENRIVSFNIKGHAGYDVYGSDIVCSAVSALSLTFANGITEIVKAKAVVSDKDGFLSIDLKNEETEKINQCQILLETMLLGMKSIEINYRKYINVKVEEV